MSDIKFGFSGEGTKFHITSFYYVFSINVFHITIERGMRVEQLKLTTEEVVRMGLINLSKLKPFTDKIK